MAPTSTAEKIALQLKTQGPQTAQQLAEPLGITPMAVRQHLYRMKAQGLVQHEDVRQAVGRPSRHWSLTPSSQGEFPDAHPDLAVDLLDAVQEKTGPEGLERILRSRARRLAERYRREIGEGSLPERVASLARIRHDEGFLAEASDGEDGPLRLTENHCAICTAASRHPQLCKSELSSFRQALGPGVSVRRTEHIIKGDRRCVYEISERP